jgi:hypothetical protein
MVQLGEAEAGLATIVAQGELTAEELLTLYSELLRRDPGARTLWDLSSASLRGFKAETIERLARRVAEMGRGVRSHSVRVAVVCATQADYGLVRMLGTYLSIEHYPARLAVFMHAEEARAWLAE